MTDRSTAFAGEKAGRLGRPRSHGGLGPAIGLTVAGASSIILWDALVQIARWAATTLF